MDSVAGIIRTAIVPKPEKRKIDKSAGVMESELAGDFALTHFRVLAQSWDCNKREIGEVGTKNEVKVRA